jgi:hypothetical protein
LGILGAFFAAAKNRAIRLYLLPDKSGKRIPLLSLARLNALRALSLGDFSPSRGFDFTDLFLYVLPPAGYTLLH